MGNYSFWFSVPRFLIFGDLCFKCINSCIMVLSLQFVVMFFFVVFDYGLSTDMVMDLLFFSVFKFLVVQIVFVIVLSFQFSSCFTLQNLCIVLLVLSSLQVNSCSLHLQVSGRATSEDGRQNLNEAKVQNQHPGHFKDKKMIFFFLFKKRNVMKWKFVFKVLRNDWSKSRHYKNLFKLPPCCSV